MPELIEQYAKKFNENFPLFALMGMDDEEVEAIIQNVWIREPLTGHLIWEKKTYIDD